MSVLSHKFFPASRGIWLYHVCEGGAELQDLETGVCLEIRPDTDAGDGCYSLCRFESPTCQDESASAIPGCDVACGLSKEGAFRLLQQFADRVGALDLKDYLETP